MIIIYKLAPHHTISQYLHKFDLKIANTISESKVFSTIKFFDILFDLLLNNKIDVGITIYHLIKLR